MERVLLVEPEYDNKFPPLGLMKIATYHRNKGDIVQFYKGEAPYNQIATVDRVYITTLFTFHYDITLKCIRHYSKYLKRSSIFVGGIAATLLPSDFMRDTKIRNIIPGQLTSSEILGYKDKINIDMLPLDYDILDDILYRYPAEDNYFVYTTRGCKRGCKFCAVRILEPEFETTNNIIDQVSRVDDKYGRKRNLLVMDNNVLLSPRLAEIVKDIKSLGFTGETDYCRPNPFDQLLEKISRRKKYRCDYTKQLFEAIELLDRFDTRLKRYPKIYPELHNVIDSIKQADDPLAFIETKSNYLSAIVEKYRPKPKMIRYVDFNQGIDARLVNAKTIKLLSQLPIRPFRLACDSVKEITKFNKATKLAVENHVRHFSNYILYNWDDKPVDLWKRLNNASYLYNGSDVKIDAYSFPMKYVPFDEKDREYIGEYWNKKFLGAINVIINVTNGVVVKENDFFQKAFGSTVQEYLEILYMPDEFIRFRRFFEGNGLIPYWKSLFRSLSRKEKDNLLSILCEAKTNKSVFHKSCPQKISKMLVLYMINKSQFDKGAKTAETVIQEIEELSMAVSDTARN